MDGATIAIITAFSSGAVSLIAIIVREAVSKNSQNNRLTNLEKWKEKMNELYDHQKKADFEYNKAQDSRIGRNSEDIIRMRESLLNTREAQEKLYLELKEDRKENQKILGGLSRTLAGLDATVKGLSNVMERIDNDLRNRKQ